MSSRVRVAVVVALLSLSVGALVALLSYRRWPQNGIDYSAIAAARSYLARVPRDGPAVRTENFDDESRAALAQRLVGKAAVHRVVNEQYPHMNADRLIAGVAHAIETITRRADPDPEAYVRWAKERGCEFVGYRTPSYLIGPDGTALLDIYDRAHQWTFGKPLPSDLPPERFVVEMLRATQTMSGGRAWVREILTDDRSWFVEASVATARADAFEYTMLRDRDARAAIWEGAIGDRREHLLVCGPTLDEVIRRDGRCLILRVMLIGVSANRKPIPITVEVYHDPPSDRWLVHAITFSNMHEIFPYTVF